MSLTVVNVTMLQMCKTQSAVNQLTMLGVGYIDVSI